MRINIDGPASSDNFDTEKFVSDWIESTVTSKQLNGYNLSQTDVWVGHPNRYTGLPNGLNKSLDIKSLSVLNNVNIKNRTRNNVVNIASPKSFSPGTLRAVPIVLSCVRKINKVWWQGLLTLRQSVNKSCVFIKNVSLLRENG